MYHPVAVLQFHLSNRVLDAQYKEYLKRYNTNTSVIAWNLYSKHIKPDHYLNAQYEEYIKENFTPPPKQTPIEAEVEAFIEKIGWSTLVKVLAMICERKIAELRWSQNFKQLRVLRMISYLDDIKKISKKWITEV